MNQTDVIYNYRITDGEAVLLRCTGGPFIRVPDTLGGYPLTAVAAYAFSPAARGRPLPRDAQCCGAPDAGLDGEEPADDRAEQIELPEGVRSVGDYAFFNCRRLQTVLLPGSVASIGCGAFMNCESMRDARVKLTPDGRSCLVPLTSEVQRELCVALLNPSGERFAKLVFPAFYEESLENLPAKVFDYHVYGSGYAYRQCFRGGELSFDEYDALFYKTRRTDSRITMINLALGRLQYPHKLSDEARELYHAYLHDYGADAAGMLVGEDDLPGLEFLASLDVLSEPDVAAATDAASRAGKTECLSFLLDYRHTRFAAREKTFEF